MPADALKPVLIVLHQEHSTPGRLGMRLRRRGYPLDIRRPRFGDPLPDTLEAHAGAIIFGGSMSVNDGDEYLRREIDWISVPLREQAPFLGLCLGAQMLARQLGAAVAPHADGHVEIGWYDIAPTAAGSALMPWPDRVHQFHREGFGLPVGATLLAEGAAETFPNQAFAYGAAAFGLQFHVELTATMINRWTLKLHEQPLPPGAQHRPDHFEGRRLHDGKTAAFVNSFLDTWLARDERGEADAAPTLR